MKNKCGQDVFRRISKCQVKMSSYETPDANGLTIVQG